MTYSRTYQAAKIADWWLGITGWKKPEMKATVHSEALMQEQIERAGNYECWAPPSGWLLYVLS